MGNPKVGIVMGSDSDLKIMQDAVKVLRDFGVESELVVASAHRTPYKALQYAESAEERGIEVIIAGAGAAAHLGGVLAAVTPLPVIGVPINATALNGLDALYAMVQMPSGIPVATVAINGAKNAGILAAQILSVKEPELRKQLKAYKEKMAQEVEAKNQRVQEAVIE
ncbi:MAG: 5-(carboxyamino)imidazole ribonucleotide mutase [Peptococcaceae bacterium]|jgi:5-(carboxyamino)imidazole ribonucleotide mutase|nr:5-(carboxyamino)imidazole ribonucleotide mutase [Peptococcaceae bacterium]MBQ2003870.1 5-(carboxyamino)imidazole ribonucleotide mutase [Peptococcaceae bacterium]MBQ2021213.1 5-(carboxyamino)imidazole ribonucleotide mutase [Peptococcaceae bacterium]MBQ2369764.1 5-(carboxyamino)imidazole ribonucleotide mutase [Peptococcaceae bacterium]MBQ5369875.1 5-(carboxyamino)imidazole ribonucleotide mutase [Peptococcaceae bacterium]